MQATAAAQEEAVILTPPPPATPRINGARIFGVRPGNPLLFTIPATGQRPMAFAVDGLPEGLKVDATTGQISGTIQGRGEYLVTFRATNALGQAERKFKFVCGDTLSLTPPMGWNSWYGHYYDVTDREIRAAADAVVSSGMANFGYQYINTDDCWAKKRGDEPHRDQHGAILPNAKFPDMKALTDYIHAKGLKAGIYASPGPWTCAGHVGSYKHEESDVRTFAEWGFDLLKYDWCSYRDVAAARTREQLMKPYHQIREILKRLDRDLLLSLAVYGDDAAEGQKHWGGVMGDNWWRTTADISGVRFYGDLAGAIYWVGLYNATLSNCARPGRWNCPDYLVMGHNRIYEVSGNRMKPRPLTPNQQYTQMSMWSLMAAPLILGSDVTRLDAFTLNVLCNNEVIDVNQDPLGKQAKIAEKTDQTLILAKPMEDGSLAVGLFNLDGGQRQIAVAWSRLGIDGKHTVRDLWRQKDLGAFDGRFSAPVGYHGVLLVRLTPAPCK